MIRAVEKLSNVIKVNLEDDYYILVVLNKKSGENFHDFWLMKESYSVSNYMFGIEVENEVELIHIVENNASMYIKIFKEEYGDDLL